MTTKAFTIPTIFKAVDKMSAVVGTMNKSVQGFVSRSQIGLARAQRGFRSLISPLNSVNRLLNGFGIYFGGYLVYRTIQNLIGIFSKFQQENANLAAIMGTTVQANKALSDQAKILGLTTAKTATEVVQLQIELAKLGYTQSQIINMTPAIIAGSIALDSSLERTSLLAGSITKNWDNFSKTGSDTQHIMDVLAKVANDTSLDFSKLETALRQSAPAANAVGVSFEETVAILGALSNSNIDASQSGTGLRNIFIDSARKGHTYQQVLNNILKKSNMLVASTDKFGRRTAISGIVLAKNLKFVKEEAEKLSKVSLGYTDLIAAKRLDTYIGSLTLLKAAFQGLVLSIEDGTGKYSKFLTNLNKIGRAILLRMTDTQAARDELFKMNNEIVAAADKTMAWGKAIVYATGVLIALRIALIAFNAVLTITRGLLLIGKGSVLAWGAAVKVFNAIMWLATAALIAFNAGLAAAVGVIIAYGAALVGIAGGALYIIYQAFVGAIQEATNLANVFSEKGMWSGLKYVGAMILNLILYPLQKASELFHRLTGMKDPGTFKEWRRELGLKYDVETPGAEATTPLNPELKKQESFQEILKMERQQIGINLKVPAPYGAAVDNNNSGVPVRISSTYEEFGASLYR